MDKVQQNLVLMWFKDWCKFVLEAGFDKKKNHKLHRKPWHWNPATAHVGARLLFELSAEVFSRACVDKTIPEHTLI